MANPYFTAFKVGMTVGTAIFDRTRDDPLDAVNNKLTQIMAATTKIVTPKYPRGYRVLGYSGAVRAAR